MCSSLKKRIFLASSDSPEWALDSNTRTWEPFFLLLFTCYHFTLNIGLLSCSVTSRFFIICDSSILVSFLLQDVLRVKCFTLRKTFIHLRIHFPLILQVATPSRRLMVTQHYFTRILKSFNSFSLVTSRSHLLRHVTFGVTNFKLVYGVPQTKVPCNRSSSPPYSSVKEPSSLNCNSSKLIELETGLELRFCLLSLRKNNKTLCQSDLYTNNDS